MCDSIPLLTKKQRRQFVRNGYVILPNAMPAELLDACQEHCDEAHEGGNFRLVQKNGSAVGIPAFNRGMKSSEPVINLFHQSGALAVAEQFLGEGNVTLRDNIGQIAYVTKSETFVEEGWSPTRFQRKRKWHIDAGDGPHGDVASDFSVLMGVAMSEGQEVDENRGQLNIFPGSHTATHDFLRETIKTCPENEEAVDVFRREKRCLDLGDPVRVCMNRGDVLFAHQRLAHVPGVNLTDIIRKNIYFRIARADLGEVVENIWDSDTPWAAFEGEDMSELLPEGADQCS